MQLQRIERLERQKEEQRQQVIDRIHQRQIGKSGETLGRYNSSTIIYKEEDSEDYKQVNISMKRSSVLGVAKKGPRLYQKMAL